MSTTEKGKEDSLLWKVATRATIFILACGAGGMHYWHVSTMFENDRNFSQITPLEREMSLRTEMGFYYSFYKTIVEERMLLNGIARLAYDRRVEYPDEVNAINRFNIYPEMVTGGVYHYCSPWLQRWRSRLVDPMFFYLEGVWLCAAATLSTLFLSAVGLCGNALGGVLTVAQYLGNHAECTRVMWAPNERENWAQPFLIAQMGLVTLQLRRAPANANTITLQTAILFLNCICLLFWQFSQFILLTQLAIVFIMEQLCIVSIRSLCLLLHAHFCGLHMAMMFTQGNDMLMTSLYSSFFAVVSVYTMLLSSLRLKTIETRTDLAIETWLVFIRIGIVISATLWLKNVVSDFLDVEEDSHIFDIFYAKFTNYRTFHTMLYTCSMVFSFLPASYFWKITQTGLLGFAGVGMANVLFYWLFVSRKEIKEIKKGNVKEGESKKKKEKKPVKTEEASAEDSGIENSTSEMKARKRNARRRRKSSAKKEEDNKSDENTSKDEAASSKILYRTLDSIRAELDKRNNENIDKKEKVEKTSANTDEKADEKTAGSTVEKTAGNTVGETNEKTAGSTVEKTAAKTVPTPNENRKIDKWVQFLRRMDIDPGIFYNMAQMFVFGFMAVMVMRLKLLFTPHLCIVASLAAKPSYYNKFMRDHKKLMVCVLMGLLGNSALHGYRNFMLERSHIGEFYDGPLEELLTWVSEQTGRDAVFAGPVPITAAVLLSTRRAIVQHPHYEHKTIRQRTYAVYKTYGRFSSSELYAELSKLKVTYLILELQYCYGRSGMGCTFEEIWDHEVPALRDRPRLCHRLLTEELPHFYKVFQNENYAVFRVHDYSVRYTPRFYDT